jgi:hypothetical protein
MGRPAFLMRYLLVSAVGDLEPRGVLSATPMLHPRGHASALRRLLWFTANGSGESPRVPIASTLTPA